MRKLTRPLLPLLAALALLSGCMGSSTREDGLETTLSQYAATIRWGDFLGALDFLGAEARAAAPAPETFADMKVTSYQVLAPPVASEEHAAQTVEIRYYDQARAIERTIRDRQEWKYLEEHERWVLTSGLPAFR